ncbi:unnamed protein product [Scytosiphon promiscuus]
MTRERSARGAAVFSVVLGACLSQRAGGFVPSSCGSGSPMPPRCCSRSTARRASLAMSAESSPLSRAQLLRAVPALVGLASLGAATSARPASAALPTAEDYSFGSGSKTKKAVVQDDLSTPLPKSSVNPDNPVEVVKAVSGELDRIEALVKKERWGDALTRVRSYPLTTLKSPTLGMKSVGDVARALGVGNAKASEVLEASMEAGLTLREVEDIVFSNTRTLEFFNSADYKQQVEDLAKNRPSTDLTEPLQLISETKKLIDGVSGLMGAGAALP